MSGAKKIAVALSIVLIVGLVGGFAFHKSRPKNVIEDKLGIKLSVESKVVNFTNNIFSEYFNAKILIESDNIDGIKKELDKSFGGAADEEAIQRMPNFSNTCSWWDLNAQNIESCYTKFMSGKKRMFGNTLKSREVWAFISKDDSSRYYLYISY